MTPKLYLLDYGAGNVRSVINAINKLGYELEYITCPADFEKADKIIFPGVGAFGSAMQKLHKMGMVEPLKKYILSNRPFFGICVGMQCLYNKSEENDDAGLGIIDSIVKKFDNSTKSVPQIGWNGAFAVQQHSALVPSTHYYFVHSYAVITDASETESNHFQEWAHTLTTYGDQTFVSSVQKGNVFATQFHPEKSGKAGLQVLQQFLEMTPTVPLSRHVEFHPPQDVLTKRIIACLDVRSNDQGDLVVTKGDQYDVRETSGEVRNLGKPVELAYRYYSEGADEVTFLNITSFRDCPLEDTPMLEVLKNASQRVFVPLTIGGGIRDMTQPDGTVIKALSVAGEYFRSGADKVSIGSDAVLIAEQYHNDPSSAEGNAITEISRAYGAQAVVISVDPKRIYVSSPSDSTHHTIETTRVGPKGERYW
jgi:imidazole glycerol-phosphate synthase